MQLQHDHTSTFVLNSLEHSNIPKSVDLNVLTTLPKTRTVFEDFDDGIQDWSTRDNRSIKTYKFQSPDLDRSNDKRLSLTINPRGKKLRLRINLESQFLSRPNNLGRFSYTREINGNKAQTVVIGRDDFKNAEGKTVEWPKIATCEITIIDQETKAKLDLTQAAGHEILRKIELIE